MSLSTPFIHRPVATTLLTIAVALAGGLAREFLPVSPLPQVDFPTISVGASLPGASPETMASSVATPLERQFGRIASVTEMTSSSTLGTTGITLQFSLDRNIDAAARDVQAAINAAAGYLPANLPTKPTYRKVNPADAPILIFSITSDAYTKGKLYDVASSVLAQKLSQVDGVGQVFVGGGASPAVRVEVNPTLLNATGLGLEDIRTMLGAANANLAKGSVADSRTMKEVDATDQLLTAADYQPLIVAYRNGAAVRLSDVADVIDSVQDLHTVGLTNNKPSISIIIFREPGANIIATVDRILAMQPELKAELPANCNMIVALDRTGTIRASVADTQFTLMLSIGLVVLVVFFFLRDWRTTLIPSVAVPVSLVGTFGVMYLMGYSIDNLSLMALTIATGFVVDDAIVVIENITRHLEEGAAPLAAALKGAEEISFTVLSISISLVAVFIPILLMGGIVGRLFREFAVVLSVAIAMSMVISLTTTPMMCAVILKSKDQQRHGRLFNFSESIFDWVLRQYERTLAWVLRHSFLMIIVTVLTIFFTGYLYVIVHKGFFPQQDTGRLTGNIQADQDTSFQQMSKLVAQFSKGVTADPAVDSVIAFSGGGRGTTNTASMFVALKSLPQRHYETGDQVIGRLRGKLSHIPGAKLYLQLVQDLRIGGRSSNAQYQYTLQGEDLDALNLWAPRLVTAISKLTGVADVSSDQQNAGLEANLEIDRDSASRLGVNASLIDNVLYDAFGQREVSTMYESLNQYYVVMEVDPKFAQDPHALRLIYLPTTGGAQTPLSTVTRYSPNVTPLQVNHTSVFPSITISFNLLPGVSLSQAVTEIQDAELKMGMPTSIHGAFAGAAAAYQDSLANEPILIAAALVTVFIVLGILYESYIHPITILSTLPSAGVGALLALIITNTDLSVIALIGIILLIGIVKKNAIMMIDFALEAERSRNLRPREAIFQACLLRFRPIMMTTAAALLGGLPLALGRGTGSELRHPLGISIVGGLIFSQALTLYTTPVIYIYMDRFRLWSKRLFNSPLQAPPPWAPAPA